MTRSYSKMDTETTLLQCNYNYNMLTFLMPTIPMYIVCFHLKNIILWEWTENIVTRNLDTHCTQLKGEQLKFIMEFISGRDSFWENTLLCTKQY